MPQLILPGQRIQPERGSFDIRRLAGTSILRRHLLRPNRLRRHILRQNIVCQDIVRVTCVLAVLACAVCGTFGTHEAAGQSFSPTAEWKDDANLNDVFFIDANLGWAVGDRGTIMRTEDGGRRWINSTSPVECTLESVFFINPRDGWAVGGYARPITHLVSGIVLRTVDGGQTWRRVAAEAMPWIHRIVMEDENHGWALVTRSAWAPAGLMLTDNGGLNWRSFAGNVEGEWTDAARLAPNVFAVVGRDKTAGIARRGELDEAIVVNPGRFDLTSMAMVDAQYGWAAGTSGTVAMTTDGGSTWDLPASPRAVPDPRTMRHFDWQSVAAWGDHVWLAGAPGTRIAHSSDQGRTWQWVPTGTSLPIRRLFFWNDQRGWAVGDGGLVLATMDAGRTWRVLRQSSPRVAMLGIYDRLEDVPLELLSRYAGNDGNYTAIAMTQAAPLAGMYDSPARDRLRQSLAEVGVSGLSWARQNPFLAPPQPISLDTSNRPEITAPLVRSRGELEPRRLGNMSAGIESVASMIEEENSESAYPDQVSREQLKEYLVRLVRQWRPDVIVSDARGSQKGASRVSGNTSARLTSQLLAEVFADAADANAYREQLTEAGLEVWAPTKLYLRAARDTRVDEMLATSQFAPRLGTSLEDYCLTQNGLIKAPELDPEIRPGWILHASTLANPKAHRSLLSGLNQQTIREVQRPLAPPGPGNLGVMQRQARKWEWIERVMVSTESSKGDPSIWQQEVDRLLIGLDEVGKGNALFQIALEHESRGHYEAAARAMHQLVTDCEQHPFWDASMMWLIRYYVSAEARWRLDPEARAPHIQLAAFEEAEREGKSGVELAGRQIDEFVKDPVQVPFSLQQRIRDHRVGEITPSDRAIHARKLIRALDSHRGRVSELASMQLALSVLNRRTSGMQNIPSHVLAAAKYSEPAWQRVGKIEEWLMDGQGAPPLPVVLCNRVPDPPQLDGKLDDALWQVTPEISLALLNREQPAQQPSGVMKVARDNEFLYLAFRCKTSQPIKPLRSPTAEAESQRQATAGESGDASQRRRDQDLTDADRIWIALDVDRDYTTAFSLEIDVHGRPREASLAVTDWDPQWFVACEQEQSAWTLEIAIPFSQLQEMAPSEHEAWGFAVRQIPAGEETPVTSASLFAAPNPECLLLFNE